MELLRFNFYVAHKVITSAAAALPLRADETIGACPFFSLRIKKPFVPRKNDKIMEKRGAHEMDEKILL
jgi:hypothetical protein